MDFIKWQVYLEQDLNGFHREDYNFAQIAALIHNSNCEKGKSRSIKDFILQFTAEEPKSKVMTEDRIREKMIRSRGAWANLLGMSIPMDDLVQPKEEEDE